MKLSICIPNYNKSDSLIKLLDDIHSQDTFVYEVLICDDFSDITHYKKILKYVNDYKLNIKIFRNNKNLGMMPTINKLIDMASGDYITIFHNDDRISKKYLQYFSQVVKDNSKYNIYTSNAAAIDNKLNIINEFRLCNKNEVLKKSNSLNLLALKSMFYFFGIIGATIYKSNFLKSNRFNTKYNTEADLFSNIRFLSMQDIFYIDKPLYFVTLNNKTQSFNIRNDNNKLLTYVKNVFEILNYFKNKKQISRFFYYHYKAIIIMSLIKNRSLNINKIKMLNIKYFEILLTFLFAFFYFYNLLLKKIIFMRNKNYIKKYLPY